MAGQAVFDAQDAALIGVFGELVRYTPTDPPGTPSEFKAVFQNPDQPLESFDAPVEFQNNGPAFAVLKVNVATPKEGDTIERIENVDGITWRVLRVELDEGGFFILNMEEV